MRAFALELPQPLGRRLFGGGATVQDGGPVHQARDRGKEAAPRRPATPPAGNEHALVWGWTVNSARMDNVTDRRENFKHRP